MSDWDAPIRAAMIIVTVCLIAAGLIAGFIIARLF